MCILVPSAYKVLHGPLEGTWGQVLIVFLQRLKCAVFLPFQNFFKFGLGAYFLDRGRFSGIWGGLTPIWAQPSPGLVLPCLTCWIARMLPSTKMGRAFSLAAFWKISLSSTNRVRIQRISSTLYSRNAIGQWLVKFHMKTKAATAKTKAEIAGTKAEIAGKRRKLPEQTTASCKTGFG